MTAVDTPQTSTPLVHAEGALPLGGCIPRIWAICRACGLHVTFCHLSNADIRAIMRRGYRCAACREGC